MTNKKDICCRDCIHLGYYDWYFCIINKNPKMGANLEREFFIDNINTTKCEKFKLRKERFWESE